MQGRQIGYLGRSSFDQNPERQLDGATVGKLFTGEDSPMTNLMLSVMGAFADFERALIRERQREGIACARFRDQPRNGLSIYADDRLKRSLMI